MQSTLYNQSKKEDLNKLFKPITKTYEKTKSRNTNFSKASKSSFYDEGYQGPKISYNMISQANQTKTENFNLTNLNLETDLKKNKQVFKRIRKNDNQPMDYAYKSYIHFRPKLKQIQSNQILVKMSPIQSRRDMTKRNVSKGQIDLQRNSFDSTENFTLPSIQSHSRSSTQIFANNIFPNNNTFKKVGANINQFNSQSY